MTIRAMARRPAAGTEADDTTIIGTVEKNVRENVRVALTEFNGHRLIDIRVFAEHRETGQPVPTKTGVTIRVARLPRLIELLQDAEAEAIRRGLLTERPR